VAELLGIPSQAVEVHGTLLGGSFGRRLAVDYALEAAAVSRAAGHPVQVVWSREDDMAHGHFHPASVHRLVAGLHDGRLVAWFHAQAATFLTLYPPTSEDLRNPAYYQDSSWGQYDVPYAVPNLLTEYSAVDSPVRSGPWRSVYSPPATFARECFVDEVAHALGEDPLALRLKLLDGAPLLKVGSLTIDRARFRRVLQLAAEKAGWGAPLSSHNGRRFGRGIAGNVYDGNVHVAEVAEVSVGPQGDLKVHRVVCVVDCGRVVNPWGLEAQIEGGVVFGLSAAFKTRIRFKDGQPVQSNFLDYPVLRMRETPTIEVHLVPSDDPPRGIGEPPVPPAAPAVLNAVFAATGRRIRRLPLAEADLA
jgi:isoquinoline 1-oxidoreductase beta subunit